MRGLGWLLIAGVIATSGCCTSCGGPPLPGFVMGQAPAENVVEQPAVPPVQTYAATDRSGSHVE